MRIVFWVAMSLCAMCVVEVYETNAQALSISDESFLNEIRGGVTCYKMGIKTCTPADKKTCEQKAECKLWAMKANGEPDYEFGEGEMQPDVVYKWLCKKFTVGIQDKKENYTTCVENNDHTPTLPYDVIQDKMDDNVPPEKMYEICYKIDFCKLECGQPLTDGIRRCVSGTGADCPDPTGLNDTDCRKVIQECKIGPDSSKCGGVVGS